METKAESMVCFTGLPRSRGVGGDTRSHGTAGESTHTHSYTWTGWKTVDSYLMAILEQYVDVQLFTFITSYGFGFEYKIFDDDQLKWCVGRTTLDGWCVYEWTLTLNCVWRATRVWGGGLVAGGSQGLQWVANICHLFIVLCIYFTFYYFDLVFSHFISIFLFIYQIENLFHLQLHLGWRFFGECVMCVFVSH